MNRIFDIDFALKYLDKKIKPFAIALFPPQEIILKLLKKFNVIPIIKDDMKEILSEISKHIDNQSGYKQYI